MHGKEDTCGAGGRVEDAWVEWDRANKGQSGRTEQDVMKERRIKQRIVQEREVKKRGRDREWE